MNFLRKAVVTIAIAAFWLLVWILIASLASNELIFPSPLLVFEKLIELAATSDFWEAVGASLLRVIGGVTFAALLAVIAAALAARFGMVRKFLFPLNEIVKATPIVSFIFIAYIVFNKSIGLLPVFIVMLIVFPIIYGALLNAFDNVDRVLIEVADVFGATGREKLRYLWLPTAFSAFTSSASTSIGLGWKAGIAAEALASAPALISIGTQIATSKTYIETIEQFAWTVAIIILSVLIELIFSFAMNKIKAKLL